MLVNQRNNRATEERFQNNPYKMFVCNLFCDDSRAKLEDQFGKNLFQEGTDFKAFLEDFFKIQL